MDVKKDLFLAAYEGNIKKCERLIKEGGDFETKDGDGISIAKWADMIGKTDIRDLIDSLKGH